MQIYIITLEQMYFFQIYTIIIVQMYFRTMIHRLMWVYFGLIGKKLHNYCCYANECFRNYLD